jgi:hypothetical protein
MAETYIKTVSAMGEEDIMKPLVLKLFIKRDKNYSEEGEYSPKPSLFVLRVSYNVNTWQDEEKQP